MRWLVVLVILLAATRAGADPESIRIVYVAPATGCPDEDHVAALLLDRSGATRSDDAGVRTFRLAIAPASGGGFRGTLDVVAIDGASTTRDVSSPSCRETVDALVLVAALAIEEAASAVVAPLVGPAIPAVPPAPPVALVEIAPAVRARTVAWAVAAEAGFARYSGASPDAEFGVPIAVVARHVTRSLRVVFDATRRDADAATRTTFSRTAGRIEGCPIGVTVARVVELAPCLGFQAGIVNARGTARPDGGARPWLAPEALGRLAVRRGRLVISVAGGVVVPLVRDRYLDVANTLYRVPAVATLAEIDLAITIW